MTPADTIREAAATLTAAARAQPDQTPAPEDFRDISLALEQVLDALFAINGNIGAQLARPPSWKREHYAPLGSSGSSRHWRDRHPGRWHRRWAHRTAMG